MCDPITIAGVALTAASTGLNAAAQSRAANARNDAMAAERIRQQGLDKEADALNLQSQDRYQGFEGKQEDRSKELGDYFTSQAVPEPGKEAALPNTTSNITVQEESKQRDKAREYTDRAGNALGNLRSFGDLLGGIGRLQARDATQIGQIGGFKKGSSSVLGYELEEASKAGDGLKLFADLAGGFGSLATTAGLSRPQATAATAGAVPTGAGVYNGAASVTGPAANGAGSSLFINPTALNNRSLYNLYGR